MASKAKHQLVVLSVISGDNFPTSEAKLTVRAQLGGVWLATEPVMSCSCPKFGDQKLVWEVTLAQLRECRSRKVMLKVEVWVGTEMLGHLVLDLRTAVPLHNKHDEAPVRNYRLIGSGTGNATTMDLSLALEEVDVITHDLSEDEPDTVMSNIKQVNQTNRLSPVLVESGVNGGYFLIASQSHCNQKFSLSICLVTAENLHLLLPNGLLLNPQDPFYFQYDMLGVDISTEQFTNLEKPEFVSEKATAMICSTQEFLSKFLCSATVTLKLCCGSVVLAAADLGLGCVLPDTAHLQDRRSYQGNLDLVASHNLTVPRDEEGNKPKLGVTITLEKEEMALSTGRLSDSEVEVDTIAARDGLDQHVKESVTNEALQEATDNHKHDDDDDDVNENDRTPVNIGVEQQVPTTSSSFQPPRPVKSPQPSPTISPTKLTITPAHPTQLSVTPTTPVPTFTPAHLPQSNLADTTDYLSPPHPVSKSYKLSLELKTIQPTDPSMSFTQVVLAYKYLALHRETITTANFSLVNDKATLVPGGFCQFSFAVPEVKMKQTFDKHLLKVGMYVEGERRGLGSINLAKVVIDGSWSGRVDMMGTSGVLAHLEVDIRLEEGENVAKKKDVPAGDMLAMAAKELETWKMDQKKRFNESLVQVEAQHLALLGKEWREREKERERVVQEKMETLRFLEEELRQELEKLEVERREMEERKRNVENERELIEKEKFDLKNEKIASVEKLKQQVREKDAENAIKTAEIDLLRNKLLNAKGQFETTAAEKKGSNDKHSLIVAELNQIKAEKISLIANLDQANKEKQFYLNNCEELRKEVVKLQLEKERIYVEKMSGLENEVKDLSQQLKKQKEANYAKYVDIPELGKNAETQTPNVHPQSAMPNQPSQMSGDAAGLARLEENLAMLRRTGVYRETDHVVVKLSQQIEKLREKIRKESGER